MNYWKKGCNHLLKCDPVFIKYYNPKHKLKTNKNKFDVLFKSICSQQISVSAAMSIYKNSKHIIGPINFTNFRNNNNKIKKLPLSNNKKKCLFSLLENYHLVSKIKLNEINDFKQFKLINAMIKFEDYLPQNVSNIINDIFNCF